MVAWSARTLPQLSSPVRAAAGEVFQTAPSEQFHLRRPPLTFPCLWSGRAEMRVFPDAGDPDKCDLQSVLDAVYQVFMDGNAVGEFWMEVENAVEGAVHKNLLVTKLSKFHPQEIQAKVAALTRWRRWLENSAWRNLPWRFPVNHGLLSAHLRPIETHQPGVPETLTPWQFCNLVIFAKFANGPQALIVRIV